MSSWFTSDEHYGHRAIINLCGRPFARVEEMDEALIARHNATVGVADTVYHLGDFAWDDRRAGDYLVRLHGRHILVAGNHDRCHPCHKRHTRAARRYAEAGFRDVVVTWQITLPGLGRVLLNHLPPSAAGTGPEDGPNADHYATWRPPVDLDGCAWLLHGHVHTAWQRRGNLVNVGVDPWNYRPVSVEEIVALVADEEGGGS